MRGLLTPKQVARAIQVSESSIKRWCDKGVIRTQYTAGGHRRIPLDGLLEFLKQSKHELVSPEVIGLPASSGPTRRGIERSPLQLVDALLTSDEPRARQIMLDLYLAEHSMSAIFDDVFAVAFEEIGKRWECGDAEVYQERRSCEIATRLLHEMQTFVPRPTGEAPLAIGGTVEGDHYSLATLMVELAMLDFGWNAVSLGSNLPFSSLASAIQHHRPRLFWISCSHIEDEELFVSQYTNLYENFGRQVAFVVGGNAMNPELRSRIQYAAYCENLRRLEGFASSLTQSSTIVDSRSGHSNEGTNGSN